MALVNTLPRITRTGDADCTRSAPTLPTMGMVVHLPMTTIHVQRVVAVSQWTVLEPGIHMEHASTIQITRIGDADSTRSVRVLPTMGTDAVMLTTTSPVLQAVAISQWTVLELGVPMTPASMTRKTTRMRDADSIQ